jgi:thiol-disulfide isomerase/thioredoxin
MLIQNIISFNQFNEYLNNYKYIIINIGASWCKPCAAIKPHIEKFISVIDEANYIYLKIDNSIFEEDNGFEKFFSIDKIPYFAFIKNGIIIDNFISGDFNIVSKRLFDNITKEREDDKKKYTNLDINEDF